MSSEAITRNDLKAILENLGMVATETGSSVITAGSGFSVASTVRKCGNVVYLQFSIWKTDNSSFAQGRTTGLGTVAQAYRPSGIGFAGVVPASNAYNSYMNRWANVNIGTDGSIFVDCYGYSDIKHIYARAVFVQ